MYMYIYIYMVYICPLGCLHPSTEIPSQMFHIYIISTIYILIISLDAKIDEDSDSELKLELGAHPELVFE